MLARRLDEGGCLASCGDILTSGDRTNNQSVAKPTPKRSDQALTVIIEGASARTPQRRTWGATLARRSGLGCSSQTRQPGAR